MSSIFLPPSTFPSLTRQTEPLDLRLTQSPHSQEKKRSGSRFYCLFTKRNSTQLLGRLCHSPPGRPCCPQAACSHAEQSTEEEQSRAQGTACATATNTPERRPAMKKVRKITALFFPASFSVQFQTRSRLSFFKNLFYRRQGNGLFVVSFKMIFFFLKIAQICKCLIVKSALKREKRTVEG